MAQTFVVVAGCDASVYVTVDLTAEQIEGLELLQKAVKDAERTCTPTVKVIREEKDLGFYERECFFPEPEED